MYSAVWDIRPSAIASDVSYHISTLAAEPLPQGGVLLLRLPDSSSDADVAEALRQATQQLVPRLDCDMKLDVQVRFCWHVEQAEGCSLNCQTLHAPQRLHVVEYRQMGPVVQATAARVNSVAMLSMALGTVSSSQKVYKSQYRTNLLLSCTPWL